MEFLKGVHVIETEFIPEVVDPKTGERLPDGQTGELVVLRQEFFAAALSGSHDAQALAAQLLLVQSAPQERLPQLLKETGEAYYRWRPKAAA